MLLCLACDTNCNSGWNPLFKNMYNTLNPWLKLSDKGCAIKDMVGYWMLLEKYFIVNVIA